ncbi:hypothetical protein H5410_064486 [Solanum commersonii]|uniref:Uncharacterized protein n=1 Tax=Solanum commersonii TaxID=4109 RepID=A0A9J5VZ95_SOLCO|nr:hypothetical protein H5410_064486 [Solanum commersonii]
MEEELKLSSVNETSNNRFKFPPGSTPLSSLCRCTLLGPVLLVGLGFGVAENWKLNELVKTSEEYYSSGIVGVLHLERLLPENHATTIDALVARDQARHARILRTTTSGLVNFPLNSSFDLNNIGYLS